MTARVIIIKTLKDEKEERIFGQQLITETDEAKRKDLERRLTQVEQDWNRRTAIHTGDSTPLLHSSLKFLESGGLRKPPLSPAIQANLKKFGA